MNVQYRKTTFTADELKALQARVQEHRKERNLSWDEVAGVMGVPRGTLSVWVTGKYAGDNEKVAMTIQRYFDNLEVQQQMVADLPTAPAYQPTPSSRRIIANLRWAQRGKIVAIACAPGIGKSSSARQHQAEAPNVWIATMSPSTSGVQPMQQEVLASLGMDKLVGSPQQLTREIRKRVQGTNGLMIMDEAQHLSEKALEEIRSWHDATGIGIALMGSQTVIQRLEGGSRKDAFAQLFSRVSMRHIQVGVLPGDARMLAEAWGIDDPAHIAFLETIATKPGALRGMSMVIELAMLTAGQEAVTLADLREAWTQLSSRPIAA